MSKRDRTIRQAAKLILAGRYGRAMRVMARLEGGSSPRLLKTEEECRAWATKVLSGGSAT